MGDDTGRGIEENKTSYITYTYDNVPDPPFDGKYRTISDQIVEYMVRRVRSTIEYKSFIQYMKKTLKINGCSFYKDYNMNKGFVVELHHCPLTLFDIVKIIATKFYQENEDDPHFEPWLVEETVNKLHYEFLVGLTPLNPTAHKLVHGDKLKVHPVMVHGSWDKFATAHWDYMDDHSRKVIEDFREMSKKPIDLVPSILKYKPVLISNVKYKTLGSVSVEKFIIDRLKTKFLETKN